MSWRDIPVRHPWWWTGGCFAIVAFPQWFQSVWGLFSTNAPIPTIRGWLNTIDVTLPSFSPYWITISMGLLMFGWLAVQLQSRPQINNSDNRSVGIAARVIYVPINEVAIDVYGKTRGTRLGGFIETVATRNGKLEHGTVLDVCAAYIADTTVPIFGKHPPSIEWEKLDRSILKRGRFENGSFHRYGNDDPEFTQISILAGDHDSAVNQIIEIAASDKGAVAQKEPAPDVPAFRSVDEQWAEYDAAFLEAAFERNKESRKAAVLRLAQLRTDGVALRNEAKYVQDASLQSWSESVDKWMYDAINVVWQVDEADSEWFKILDTVPPPRITISSFCKNQSNQAVHLSVYRNHDLRLVRLEQLLKKYGVAA